jgi:hypothetical protein
VFGSIDRWLAALAAFAAFTWATLGFAAEERAPLELAWLSPEECPSGKTVADDALRLASADGKPLPNVRAKVRIERTEGSSYVLTLTTETGGSGSVQSFRAANCSAVAQAAAVTLALLLNPSGASHPAPPTKRPLAVPPEPASRQSLPLRSAAFGLVGAQFGLLPKVGPTFGAELGLELGRASAWLGGAYGPPQRALLKGQKNVGGELSLVHAMFYGCGAIAASSPSLNLCAGLDFSRVSGRGVGVADERVGAIYWFSVLGGAVTDLALHRNIALRIGAFAAAPLDHPAAFVEGAGDVQRPAAVIANLHAGVGVVWP